MNDEEFEKFKKIYNAKVVPDMGIFMGKNKMKDPKDVDLRKLGDDIMKWGDESQRGLCCGIYGCVEPVDERCPRCDGGYCKEHRTFHDHDSGENGVIIREVE